MRVGPSSAPPARRLIFGALAAFILLSPALPQIFRIDHPAFRPWIMFSGVGLGLLRGEIVVEGDEVRRLSPKAFLNLPYYPHTMSIRDAHVVLDEAALNARMAAYCAEHRAASALSFDGDVSGLRGWRALSVRHECGQ